MKRPLALCGLTLALGLGVLFVVTSQEPTLGQQSGAQAGGQGGGGRFRGTAGLMFGQVPLGNDSDSKLLGGLRGRSRNVVDEALRLLVETDSEEKRELAKKELKHHLENQFKEDMEHRQAELDKIKQRVEVMEAVLEKRAAAKEDIIDLRLQVLVQEAEGLGWANGSGEQRRTSFGRSGFGRGYAAGSLGSRGRGSTDDAEDYGGLGRGGRRGGDSADRGEDWLFPPTRNAAETEEEGL